MNLKNKKVWLLSALSFVLGAGLSAGVFYYKGQFKESSFERQAQNEALSETDDYKIQTQMKVAERTPQSKIKTSKAAVTLVLGRTSTKPQNKKFVGPPDFLGQSLRSLPSGNFHRADFRSAKLINVNMSYKSFIRADFKDAELIWAPRQARQQKHENLSFEQQPLARADFTYANFQDAVIHATDLRGASFRDAKMQGVRFKTPKIKRVPGKLLHFTIEDYPDTFFWPDKRYISIKNPFSWDIGSSTDFSGAYLQGADLRELEDLHLARLGGALYNSKTKFPEGFNPKEHGMILND